MNTPNNDQPGLDFVNKMAAAAPPSPNLPAVRERALVDFHGDRLEAVQLEDGTLWVSVAAACGALGVDQASQRRKLGTMDWARTASMPLPSAGGTQATMMILVDHLPMWLGTISAAKASPDVRDKLVRFQIEARDVLRDHFAGRRPSAAVQRGWRSTPPSGGARGSGGAPVLMSQALEMMVELARRQEGFEQRLEAVESNARRAPSTTAPVIEILRPIRIACASDIRLGVYEAGGKDPGGERNHAANQHLMRAIGKPRPRWTVEDFMVACDVAQRDLGFRMSSLRARLPATANTSRTA